MTQCDFCGKEIQTLSTFTCSYCGKTFCPEHRLPFNHNCVHIEAWKQTPPPGQRRVQQKSSQSPISTKTGTGFVQRGISPWVIGASILVLILIGIVIGIYVL